ncbi:MAG: hypothetical protein ABJA98_19230 [Acidobacteriota bacterium]
MVRTKQKIPVSTRALVQRINRKIAADGKRLIANRGAKSVEQLGAYCIVNGRSGHTYVLESRVDLEATGRKIGALAEWEFLDEK